MSWDEAPVVITVAPTGAEVTRADNAALPHTPSEIATAVIACADAGASVAHLHVRESDGTPASRLELFTETIDHIRSESRIILNVSTGGAVWMPISDRMTGLDAQPDMAGVETGSLNFGDEAFVTTPIEARGVIEQAVERGIELEAELFDVGHVIQAVRMLDRGELPSPLRANIVLGVPGGVDASPEGLAAMRRPLPVTCFWSVTAVGRYQRRMLAMAVLLGAGGIRLGFEDSVYIRRGQLATSNAQLIHDAASLVESLGRRVATIDEARAILSIPSEMSPVR